MKHLIIDVETLAVAEKAVVLQIAAALHDSENKETMFESLSFRNWKLEVKSQSEHGRVVERETLEWWKTQPIEVQRQALIPNNSDVDPEAALVEFEDWLISKSFNKYKDFIWQRGSKDQDWVCSLMRDCGWIPYKLPISFHRVRDIRTCVDVLGQSSKLNGYPDNTDELRGMVPDYKQHDAMSDIKLELLILRQCGIL